MTTVLRFDGLYRHLRKGDQPEWLRFYDDGTALSASTSPTCAAQIAGWLRPAAPPHISHGRWTLDASTLTVNLVCSFGSQVAGPQGGVHTTTEHLEGALALDGASARLRFTNTTTYNGGRTLYGERDWTFIPVGDAFLTGPKPPNAFRHFSGFSALVKFGFAAEQLAQVKKTKGITLAKLHCYERDELLAAGLDGAFVEAFIRWRHGG